MSKKKILIANIGNRSLIDLSKKGDDIYIANKLNFRDDTECFFFLYKENGIEAYKDLKLNILNTLLEHTTKEDDNIRENLEKIILFSSDQYTIDESRAKQDTRFAGNIIVELIKRDYDKLAENKILKGCSVVNIDELINRYKEELQKISKEYPVSEYQYIICDSGGTPQQKSSLKIVVEYLLERGDYEFYNIYEEFQEEHGLQKSKAEPATDKEYKRLIDNQQIKMLIKTGQYKAAAEICGFLEGDDYDRQKIKTFLEFAGMRLNNVIDEKIRRTPTSDFSNIPSLKKYRNALDNNKEKEPIGHYSDWSELLKKDDFFQICEVLSIADWYWSLEDYNNSTLYFSIFIETYINSIISNQKDQNGEVKFDLVEGSKESKRKFETELMKESTYDKIKPYINCKLEHIKDSLRTRSAYCKILNESNTKHQEIIAGIFSGHYGLFENKDTRKKTLQYKNNRKKDKYLGLYELRNKYAHNGQGIDEDKIIDYVCDFESIINTWKQNILGKKNKNIYNTINQEIEKLLDKTHK